jgi:hypothetical protein
LDVHHRFPVRQGARAELKAMKRLFTLLAATAASAAVTAAITLPAGASDQSNPKDAPFVACLRDHGLAIPADTTGDAIKGWLLAHDHANSAVEGCKPDNPGGDIEVAQMAACLRDHGLNPPSDPDQLKPWLVQQDDSAALKACGFDPGAKPTNGGDKPSGPCVAAEPADPAATAAKKRQADAAKRQ